jgi:hypothetical protein
MKPYFLAVFVGLAACLVGSVLPVVFWANPRFLFRVSVLPTLLASVILVALAPRVYPRRAVRHVVALGIGFLTVAVGGSVCAATAQVARFGYDRINVSGYFVDCWLYATIFLPLSYVTALFILRLSRPSTPNETPNQAIQRTAPRPDA